MCVVHVSLVPVIGVVGEQKTKPTQHSVQVLRSLGLNPNILACRCEKPLEDAVREKLVSSCIGCGAVGGGGCVEAASSSAISWDGMGYGCRKLASSCVLATCVSVLGGCRSAEEGN